MSEKSICEWLRQGWVVENGPGNVTGELKWQAQECEPNKTKFVEIYEWLRTDNVRVHIMEHA